MKITMFQAGDGDCLLVRGADGTHILVDGGRKGSFVEHTLPMLDDLRLDGHDLDLVYVSHIDNDHISGILTLTDLLVQWLVFDFQKQHNPHFKEPPTKSLRPPMVKHIWHNAFREMVGENAGPIEDMLILAGQSFSLREQLSEQMSEIDNLVTGVNEAVELNLRLKENLRDIVLNAPFNGKLMYRQDPPVPLMINGLVVRVVSPTLVELEKLRTTWNDFLQSSRARINDIRSAIEEEGRGLGLSEEAILHRSLFNLAEQFVDLGSGTITVPNIASLTLLVEEQIGPKVYRILLAGDAGSDELLAGLEAHDLINPHQGLHVDVLKVQHHGAIANVTERFCKTVTADHYLFCSNGNHDNPEDEVLKALVSARLGAMANESISPGSDKPFRFWFSSSEEAAGTTDQKKRMADVEEVMKDLRKQYGAQKFSTRFLRHGSKHTFTL